LPGFKREARREVEEVLERAINRTGSFAILISKRGRLVGTKVTPVSVLYTTDL
jgi:hypothetical protein